MFLTRSGEYYWYLKPGILVGASGLCGGHQHWLRKESGLEPRMTVALLLMRLSKQVQYTFSNSLLRVIGKTYLLLRDLHLLLLPLFFGYSHQFVLVQLKFPLLRLSTI